MRASPFLLMVVLWFQSGEIEGHHEGTDRDGVTGLIEQLGNKDVKVVQNALGRLAELRKLATPAMPAIVKTLQHSDGNVRIDAARALIDLDAENQRAITTLLEAAKSRDAKVRALAVRVIGDIAQPPLVLELSCWGGRRWHRQMPEIGPPAIPVLRAALKDTNADVRATAAYSLGQVAKGAKAAVPDLIHALADPDVRVARGAAASLGDCKLDAKDAVPALREIAARCDKPIGLQAAASLYYIDRAEFGRVALPVIVAALRDETFHQPVKAELPGLGGPGVLLERWAADGEKATSILGKLLNDPDPSVQHAAVVAMSRCNDAPAAARALAPMLRDPNLDIRRATTFSLGRLGKTAGPVAVPALTNALDDPEDMVIHGACHALVAIGPAAKPAAAALVKLIRDPKSSVSSHEVAAATLGHIGADPKLVLDVLVPLLKHEHYEVRSGAASGIGGLKEAGRPALPALVEQLKRSEGHGERNAVSWAIKYLGPKASADATDLLVAALKEKDKEVRRIVPYSLVELDTKGKSIPALIERLKNGDAELRYAYIHCLGAMGEKAIAAVPLLRNYTSDSDETIRKYAREALERIEPMR